MPGAPRGDAARHALRQACVPGRVHVLRWAARAATDPPSHRLACGGARGAVNKRSDLQAGAHCKGVVIADRPSVTDEAAGNLGHDTCCAAPPVLPPALERIYRLACSGAPERHS